MHAPLHTRQGADRRKYARTPVDAALDLRASGIELPITANLRDISPGGVGVDCRINLALKHPVRIALPLPGAKPILVDGNIIRALPIPVEKKNHYGIRFRVETAALRDNLVMYIAQYCHPQEKQSKGELIDRRAHRATEVDAKFSVTVSANDVRPFNVMAIAFGTHGIRLASDRVLRQEWTMKLELHLPGAIVGGPICHVTGRAKPGAKSVRGSYVQDVDFVEPSLNVITEIERAMSDVIRKSRRAS